MDRDDLRLLLPKPIRTIPVDLAAVVVVVVLTVLAVLLPVVNETPIRTVIGLPFVLFLPGYAFVAAVFPEEGESPTQRRKSSTLNRGGIDLVDRLVMSLVSSVAIVPLIGLTLHFTPFGVELGSMLFGIAAFIIGCTVVATVRRNNVPQEDRFVFPYRSYVSTARRNLLNPNDRIQGALNVALVVSILIATVSVGYALTSPQVGEQYTEFYLLTEDEETEELVASNYPEEFVQGESEIVTLGIDNEEHRTVDYTVVIQLQRVEDGGDVVDREELDRFDSTLEHNETWMDRIDVTPTFAGEDLRLVFLLYEDEPPEEPTVENAYRFVHLWVDVEESASED